ncbi:MAG: hypothetical protein ACTS4W_01080 [Candidatus Hodgkinia cicadicola]
MLNEVKHSDNTNLRKFDTEDDKARKLTWTAEWTFERFDDKVKQRGRIPNKIINECGRGKDTSAEGIDFRR